MTPEQAAQMCEERRRAIEPRRLRRAARLVADKIAPGQYAVRGDSGKVYYVDLAQEIPCMCADVEYRDVACKHTLRARMGEGDERVLQALGDMLLRDQQHLAEFLKHARSNRNRVRT